MSDITKPEEVVKAVRKYLNKEHGEINAHLKKMRDDGVNYESESYQEALLKAREASRVLDNVDRVLRITECKIPGADIPC